MLKYSIENTSCKSAIACYTKYIYMYMCMCSSLFDIHDLPEGGQKLNDDAQLLFSLQIQQMT